ncbi:hypothetical protein HY380_00805 [Candidatus Saccharibacteria bacterium]|nr:hypothetical protein [Candidatus Saccharibacteria bacterium]
MTIELAPPRLEDGVRRLFDVLANPQPMTAEELKQFRVQINYLFDVFPANAALVGGNAVRLWLNQLGLPVPQPISGDFDIVTWGGGPPDPGVEDFQKGPGPIIVDIIHTWEPFEYPFFTQIEVENRPVPVATLPTLVMMKAQDVVWENPNPQFIAKDHFYYGLLKQLVSRPDMDKYLAAYLNHVPAHIVRTNSYVDFLVSEGLASPARA